MQTSKLHAVGRYGTYHLPPTWRPPRSPPGPGPQVLHPSVQVQVPVQSKSQSISPRSQSVEVQVALSPHPLLPPSLHTPPSCMLYWHTRPHSRPSLQQSSPTHPIPPDSCPVPPPSNTTTLPPLSRLNSNTTFFSSRSLNFLPTLDRFAFVPDTQPVCQFPLCLSLSPSLSSQPFPQADILFSPLSSLLHSSARPPTSPLSPPLPTTAQRSKPTDPNSTSPGVFLTLATASWPNRRPNLPDNPI